MQQKSQTVYLKIKKIALYILFLYITRAY